MQQDKWAPSRAQQVQQGAACSGHMAACSQIPHWPPRCPPKDPPAPLLGWHLCPAPISLTHSIQYSNAPHPRPPAGPGSFRMGLGAACHPLAGAFCTPECGWTQRKASWAQACCVQGHKERGPRGPCGLPSAQGSLLESRALHIQLLPSCQHVSAEHLVTCHNSCGDRKRRAGPGCHPWLQPALG